MKTNVPFRAIFGSFRTVLTLELIAINAMKSFSELILGYYIKKEKSLKKELSHF